MTVAREGEEGENSTSGIQSQRVGGWECGALFAQSEVRGLMGYGNSRVRDGPQKGPHDAPPSSSLLPTCRRGAQLHTSSASQALGPLEKTPKCRETQSGARPRPPAHPHLREPGVAQPTPLQPQPRHQALWNCGPGGGARVSESVPASQATGEKVWWCAAYLSRGQK